MIAPKEMLPILLCCSITSESDYSGIAAEA